MRNLAKNFTFFWAATLLLFSLAACRGFPADDTTSTADSGNSTALAPVPATDSLDSPAESVPANSSIVTSLPYPGPTEEIPPTKTRQPDSYPAPATVTPNEQAQSGITATANIFLPVTSGSSQTATPPPPPTPAPLPTLDFAAVRADLQANGQDLAFAKMGFHVTLPEDRDLLDDWMGRLDQAGVPLFIKTVDNAEPLFRAQELMKASGVPHTLVYRSTGGVPHYELEPALAAQVHWQEHREKFPAELDPSLVWIETLNEPDRTKADWFGQFALETARLAMADGFRWAAFGWASGEPEPEQWQTPSMLAFLQLAGDNPEQLAIALHEYSFLEENIAHQYPYKVGRFLELFRIADERGFARPTVLITEWGWEHNNIPHTDQALRDLQWASSLYAPYPQVKGAAIWNLGIGCCFGDISDQVQQIVNPVTEFSLTNFFSIPQSPNQKPTDPGQFQP